MIINRLLNMIGHDRPSHQIPLALRDLDRAMQFVVDEQQEVAMLAKARETLLANPGQPPAAGSTSTSRPRPTVARKRSVSTSVALLVGAVTIVTIAFAGIVTLIVWAPPVVSVISLSALASPFIVYLLIRPALIEIKWMWILRRRTIEDAFEMQRMRRTDRSRHGVAGSPSKGWLYILRPPA